MSVQLFQSPSFAARRRAEQVKSNTAGWQQQDIYSTSGHKDC